MSDQSNLEYIKKIKILVTTALFSDSYFLDNLVLKGGNALDLVYKISARSSIDLDFSIENDFPDEPEAFERKIEQVLNKSLVQENIKAFDVKVIEKPHKLSPEMAAFWGGYDVNFKLINLNDYDKFSVDIDKLRRNAINLGGKTKFEIDISRFEYVANKNEEDLEGFTIYVYSIEMLIFEKLRAICQQMQEYGPVVNRKRPGTSRARDFVDIYMLTTELEHNIARKENKDILLKIFSAKRVPIEFLSRIPDNFEFHKASFPSVKDTVHTHVKLKEFDFYFNFVINLVSDLKTSWNI